jgi:hypothetical protein
MPSTTTLVRTPCAAASVSARAMRRPVASSAKM